MIIVGKKEYKEIKRKLEGIQDMLAALIEVALAQKKDEPKRKVGRPKGSKNKTKKAGK